MLGAKNGDWKGKQTRRVFWNASFRVSVTRFGHELLALS